MQRNNYSDATKKFFFRKFFPWDFFFRDVEKWAEDQKHTTSPVAFGSKLLAIGCKPPDGWDAVPKREFRLSLCNEIRLVAGSDQLKACCYQLPARYAFGFRSPHSQTLW
jgi:hypothetical protein